MRIRMASCAQPSSTSFDGLDGRLLPASQCGVTVKALVDEVHVIGQAWAAKRWRRPRLGRHQLHEIEPDIGGAIPTAAGP